MPLDAIASPFQATCQGPLTPADAAGPPRVVGACSPPRRTCRSGSAGPTGGTGLSGPLLWQLGASPWCPSADAWNPPRAFLPFTCRPWGP